MKKGFTLIELLIVIAVISILSAITLSVINVARVRGRAQDATRREAISTIAGALERMYSDTNSYPNTGTNYVPTSILQSYKLTEYIKVLPSDPINTQNYLYKSTDGQNFCLCYTSETEVENLNGCADPPVVGNQICLRNPF
mgnify:CR=1 FL=1